MAGFGGVHLAFTVSDLSRSAPWYQQVFGGQQMFQGNDGVSDVTIFALSGSLLVGLRQHPDMQAGDRFAFNRVGLDHAAFHVRDREELEDWRTRLERAGIDHSGIQESPFGLHLNFNDPDGIALELFVPAPQQ